MKKLRAALYAIRFYSLLDRIGFRLESIGGDLQQYADRESSQVDAARKGWRWCPSDLNFHYHAWKNGHCRNCGETCAHVGTEKWPNFLAPSGKRCVCGVLL